MFPTAQPPLEKSTSPIIPGEAWSDMTEVELSSQCETLYPSSDEATVRPKYSLLSKINHISDYSEASDIFDSSSIIRHMENMKRMKRSRPYPSSKHTLHKPYRSMCKKKKLLDNTACLVLENESDSY